jgi:hypothetical protein
MVWVIGNLPGCCPVEIFSNHPRTPAPITGFRRPAVEDDLEHVEGAVPRTLEAWIHAQKLDEDFPAMLEQIEHKALKNDLWILSPPESTPSIIVPLTCQELLVRDSHERLFHLAHTKVHALLRRSYFWPTQQRDVRKWLENCPACEMNKARQNTAHGLFSALPVHASRARWCMNFQGQGKALTGENEALALIDPTSRYVVVIPLKDREAPPGCSPSWTESCSRSVLQTCCIPTQRRSSFLKLWTCWPKPRRSARRRPWRTLEQVASSCTCVLEILEQVHEDAT